MTGRLDATSEAALSHSSSIHAGRTSTCELYSHPSQSFLLVTGLHTSFCPAFYVPAPDLLYNTVSVCLVGSLPLLVIYFIVNEGASTIFVENLSPQSHICMSVLCVSVQVTSSLLSRKQRRYWLPPTLLIGMACRIWALTRPSLATLAAQRSRWPAHFSSRLPAYCLSRPLVQAQLASSAVESPLHEADTLHSASTGRRPMTICPRSSLNPQFLIQRLAGWAAIRSVPSSDALRNSDGAPVQRESQAGQ